jgi:superfamily II DNA/RNA helicase
MLDMGFIEDVERIVSATPATRQTLLFSATMDGPIARLAQRILKNPRRISMAAQNARNENIEQRMHYVDDLHHKNRVLRHVLNDAAIQQAIVFTATKRDADSLAEALHSEGHSVAALHGDMNQSARNRTLQSLRRGQLRVLVATDVAARGIDVLGISHVVNFDLPKVAEDYIHRIGRTGRAGAKGIALTLVSGRDTLLLKRIERFTGNQITAHIIAGLEPKSKPGSFKPGNDKKRPPSRFGKGKPQGGGWKPAFRKAA